MVSDGLARTARQGRVRVRQRMPAVHRHVSIVLAKVQPVAAVVEQVNREIAHCRERLMVALEVVDE
mgnify:CR=1 FL=1